MASAPKIKGTTHLPLSRTHCSAPANLQPHFLHPLFTGILQSLAQSAVSVFSNLCFNCNDLHRFDKGEAPQCPRSLVISYVPADNLSYSALSSPWSSSPAASLTMAPTNAILSASNDAPSQTTVEESNAASTGPAFIGQVFTMCDASRRGLIAARPVEAPKTKRSMPFVPSFLSSMFNSRENGSGTVNETEGPIFRFFFDRGDAAAYVKKLGLAGSMVGSCPLDAAYKYFKGKPPMFKFIPDINQVRVARKLLQKDYGTAKARLFKGVPVFTARNLTIAMSTPNGVRWFTPYFFDKRHLDKLIGHSVDHYYHMLIHARRIQRHNQVVDNDFSGEMADDDSEGLLDPPEVQELMEEMGQAGSPFESVLVKAAEIHFQDMLDSVILGNRLSRQLTGLQPSFPVLVDSFEQRAAAAELDSKDKPKSRTNNQFRSSSGDHSSSRTMDDGSSTSGRHATKAPSTDGRRQAGGEARLPFQLFGKNWGFQILGGQKRHSSGGANEEMNGEPDDLASRDGESQKDGLMKEEHIEKMEPKLTMMGIAMTEPDTKLTDAGLQRAMAAAAKDIESRVRKGEGSGQEHGPLFIADLGGGPEIWGRETSSFSGWESDEND